jgi:hypothetical protein
MAHAHVCLGGILCELFCSSTATCRDGFCDLLTQISFVTGQLRTLPQSLTHLNRN